MCCLGQDPAVAFMNSKQLWLGVQEQASQQVSTDGEELTWPQSYLRAIGSWWLLGGKSYQFLWWLGGHWQEAPVLVDGLMHVWYNAGSICWTQKEMSIGGWNRKWEPREDQRGDIG